MSLRTGIDLIEISRLREAVERHGERFLARIFTPLEREQCGMNYPSLAARFAAKESVAKALGTGLGTVSFTEIEIIRGKNGEPALKLYGDALQAAADIHLTEWAVSLSHTRDHAIASVVATGGIREAGRVVRSEK